MAITVQGLVRCDSNGCPSKTQAPVTLDLTSGNLHLLDEDVPAGWRRHKIRDRFVVMCSDHHPKPKGGSPLDSAGGNQLG